MRIVLAAVGFINGEIAYNRQKIVDTVRLYSGKADLVLFGETFLQGFDSLCWEYEKDKHVGICLDDPMIAGLKECAKTNAIAISFGYIERENGALYSSQLTIGADGTVLNNYRRVSKGWKERFADAHYQEGDQFSCFDYQGRKFTVGLCGDLWDDNYAEQVKKLGADIVLWPVYTDYDFNEWNGQIKKEYAEQSAKSGKRVLYVNSVCLHPSESGLARGGAAMFCDGTIAKELPAGEEDVLLVEV